ncbi:Free methionine-R-sulfoxide reductase [compost metagenome]
MVPDVDQFPGHIACSSLSRSEIVVPYFDRNGEVAGVLDIDSEYPDAFSAIDQLWLEKIAALLP